MTDRRNSYVQFNYYDDCGWSRLIYIIGRYNHCTKRAGVWMVRQTCVCVTILSAFALSLWRILVLLGTSVREVGVFVSVAYFLKCIWYSRVCSTIPILPISARSNVRPSMWRFIKCWRAGQPCSDRI